MTNDPTAKPPFEVLHLDPLGRDVPSGKWQQLCEAALDPNPFFSPGFLKPYLENMSGQTVGLVVVNDREQDRWLMAAPIGRRRLGLGVPVRSSWATEYAPLGAPLLHPDASADAVSLFLRAAGSVGGVLAFPYLPLQSQTAEMLTRSAPGQIAVAARATRAAHGAGAAGEAQLQTAFSGKRRKEMRRLLRRLGDQGETRFVSLAGADAIQGFESFLHLEAGGWKGRSGTALLSLPETAVFSRSAIARMALRNGVRIEQLWAGKTLVASLVLFQENGSVFSWKIAFDEAFARYSPGAQIALQAFRDNLQVAGFKGADSLAIPGHTMIEPLWRGRLETGTLLVSSGLKSGPLLALCRADLALERQLRTVVRTLKKRLAS